VIVAARGLTLGYIIRAAGPRTETAKIVAGLGSGGQVEEHGGHE
jgi:hypothetical protein